MTPQMAAEAKNKPVALMFDGEEYQVLPGMEWDIEILEEAENGNITTALAKLLGPEQYKKFRSTHTKVGDIRRFFEEAGENFGGNS